MKPYVALSVLTAVLLAAPAAAQPQTDYHTTPTRDEKVADLAASWHRGPLTLGEAAATTSMCFAFGFLAFAIGGAFPDASKIHRLDRRTWTALADCALILAWSFFVRFVLTEPNILTDGGSGYGRVMRYTPGYGGLAVLVKLFPAERAAFMWHAMLIPRFLAALSPVFLAWVARGLGFGRAVALIAGLALASLPVHAALTTSDLLVGPMSSLQLAGLALVLVARRREQLDLFAAGVSLAAWAMWCRPEGALGLLPIAAASLSFPRRWWSGRAVQAVIAGLVVLVVLRATAMPSPNFSVTSAAGPLSIVSWGTILFSTVLVPVWLWMPIPFAVVALYRRHALAVALAGLVAGLTPVYLRGLTPDPANTHLETLRYGLPALAWLALVSAVGMNAMCVLLARLWHAEGRWPLLALHSLVALIVVSPVAINDEYLARRYGHATSERAIRRLLQQVPAGCGLLAPDDFAEGVSIEIYDRYRFIAEEAYTEGEASAIEVRPVRDLLDGKVGLDQCWTFLRGPYCYHAFGAGPAEDCERVASNFALDEIASIPIEFRHHRLVTGPDVRRAPWFMKHMPLVLYRVTGRNGSH